MIQQLIDDLRVYFEAKSSLTQEEQTLLNRLQDGYFPITSVHRDDLASKGFDVRKISDGDMRELAKKMANDYCEQLFWDSMEIIAEDCLEFSKFPKCPLCNEKYTTFDSQNNIYCCESCGQKWNEDLYVLTQFPDDTSCFKQEDLGYPSAESQDNNARYVPEYEYIKQYQKKPEPNDCFKPVQWPESQQYLPGGNRASTLNEPINDEFGIADFGVNAVWVPLCNLKSKKINNQ